MYITNSSIQFVWDLIKTSTVYAEDYFDLHVTDPDGVVTYYEGVNGAGWTDAYTAPDAENDGQISGTLTLNKSGLWTIILGTGGSASHTVLHSQLIMVVNQETISNKSIALA